VVGFRRRSILSTTATAPSDQELTASDMDTACLIVAGSSRESLTEELATSVRDVDVHIAVVIAKLCLADPKDVTSALVERLQQAGRRIPTVVQHGRSAPPENAPL
jgi:DNA-binding NarL/FixJ family response regulator